MWHRFILSLLFDFVFSYTLYAQMPVNSENCFNKTDQYFFDHYTQETRNRQQAITAICEFDGFMWFGTETGLHRFDGYNFKLYQKNNKNKTSLHFNNVTALLSDNRGRLWIGTSQGISIYDSKNDQFHKFNKVFGGNHSIDFLSITGLIEDKNGNVWVMTDFEGVYRIDVTKNTIESYLKQYQARYCALDSVGNVLISASDKIFKFDREKNTLVDLDILQLIPKDIRRQVSLKMIVLDSKGNLWIGSGSHGIFLVESLGKNKGSKATNIKQLLPGNFINCIIEDSSGKIWISHSTSKKNQITIYDYQTDTFSSVKRTGPNGQRFKDDEVAEFFKDKHNNLWIGTYSTGISKYNPRTFGMKLLGRGSEYATDKSIFGIYRKSNEIILATDDGVSVFSTTPNGLIQERQNPLSNLKIEVYGIQDDGKGKLWIATADTGVYVYESGIRKLSHREKDGKLYKLNYLNNFLLTRNKSELWVAGWRGISIFNLTNNTWSYPISTSELKATTINSTFVLFEDTDDNIWIGSLSHGLCVYNRKTKKVISIDNKKLSDCYTNSIKQKGNSIWVGTDCGLFEIDLKSLLVKNHYSTSSLIPFRLPRSVIYAIEIAKNGNLWFSSEGCIAEFSDRKGLTKVYEVADGLQGNEFINNSSYQHSDGTIYFGGTNGVNYFQPEDLKTNTEEPPVKITGITAMDSSYLNREHLVFQYDQNVIELEYIALNYSNSQKNQYRYKMDGIDKNWIYAGTRRNANYTNLPPGDYFFRVIGSNNDLVWNREGASLKITILPPWWETWWFRMLLILLFTGGIYGLSRYHLLQKIYRRNAEIKASAMAQEAERLRFSRELHDGVGANLSLLKMYLSSFGNKEIPMAELQARSEKLLAGSLDEIRRLIRDMHPQYLSELGLGASVKEMIQLTNRGTDIEVQYKSRNIPNHLSETIEINLYRIIQELLHNAIKHSEAKHVWLNMECSKHLLILTYKDDGKGFDTSKANEGNGLLNIRNRVTLLKGNITLNSATSQGTRFTIVVPV